ncbi:glycosyltransferase family 4 protein [Cytobacillus oceanisediminis]|uniref:glycosyltransferase family 4 protein n=1 Tax=Cytobacillus oceanisediminis TaxID=665099 RepID=UPI0011A7A002|nr:glycosyltransferase family 4 protein [Cytobacillus oceanisediminis]
MKKNVLIIGPYLPGKYFGGPVKSLLNLVETLSDYFNFYVVTGDRDLNAKEIYNDVEIGSWNQVGKARVFYVPKGKEFKYIRFILKEIDYDLVYTSSFFSKKSIIIQMLKYLNIIKKPVIVAPRGEFSSGALAIKSAKKKFFLKIYKLLKVSRNLSYTCTSKNDKQDILNVLGNNNKINIAENIISGDLEVGKSVREKKSGYLKIATVSRISKIKNIDYSLRLLQLIDNNEVSYEEIVFDIYGPLEDRNYWDECLSISGNLSEKIIVNYKGPVDYSEVIKILSNYHIFLFPTKGENFGHVIQEAFLSGCPVITSDQTPWRDLEELEVGHDIALENQEGFIGAIKQYLYMKDKEYRLTSINAYRYGVSKVEQQLSIKEHIDMFNSERSAF